MNNASNLLEYENIFLIGNPTQVESKAFIQVKCFKWFHHMHNRKYDEMFDYDTKHFTMSEYNIANTGTFIDTYTKLQFIDKEIVIEENQNSQHADVANSHLIIQANEKEYLIRYNKYAYFVCKYLNTHDSSLNINVGSIIKIGKFILKTLLVKINDTVMINPNRVIEKTKMRDPFPDERVCKICFKEEKDISRKNSQNDNEEGDQTVKLSSSENSSDPLISVCHCKGSLKYIHTSCLDFWIKSKCKIEYIYLSPNCFKIKIKGFFCEICKKNFPFFAQLPFTNESFFLLEILRQKNNFIIFKSKLPTQNEISVVTKKSEEVREFTYIELSNYYKNHITIGRDKSCDTRLDDISVSRKHCMLYVDKEKNCVKIKDLGSKFGTLVGMQEDAIVDSNNSKTAIQKGNTVYHFSYKII